LSYTVIDTETTGLSPANHEIIDFAAITFDFDESGDIKIIKETNFKIKPKYIEKAQKQALEVNGYTEEAWKNAKYFEEHAETIKNILKESETLLGQNLIFDLRFLEASFKNHKMRMPKLPKYVDTKQMGQQMVKEGKLSSASMDRMCEQLGVKFSGKAHTALTDCQRTISVWTRLLKSVEAEYFTYGKPYNSHNKTTPSKN